MNQPAMTHRSMDAIFEEAVGFDSTISLDGLDLAQLLQRYVAPGDCSRNALFGAMLAGNPCVLRGYNAPLQDPYDSWPLDKVSDAVMNWCAHEADKEKYRVYSGPTGVKRLLTLAEIAEKWNKNRTRFGVTDLHIRQTDMEGIIAPDEISRFNLLCRSTPVAQTLEMFSYVISSYGHVTDSHSDAPDSTNYCITGKKLWLAWDTYEGARVGLQDVERAHVRTKAKFDMAAFLSIPSARWMMVEQGQTLFLPANMTHKVITMERYIGVGGFYISLPNCLKLMAHWILHPPLWSKKDADGEYDFLLSDIAETVRQTILDAPGLSPAERDDLGYDFLLESARLFARTCPPAQMRQLWTDPRFRRIADVINIRWPLPANLQAA